MPPQPRHLTKSRFKLGSECPRKLYYNAHPTNYPNLRAHDEFLMALAEGGHQVGTLAQLYFPNGELIETLAHDEAVKQTNALLERETVTIYEAAIRHADFFIRVDVLVKKGNQVQLIEVKAKSHSATTEFLKNDGYLRARWEPYLDDIAFQTWMTRAANPTWEVEPYLMLVGKDRVATVSGLHQLFVITRDGRGRTIVELSRPVTAEELGRQILVLIDTSSEVERIINGTARDLTKCNGLLGSSIEERANTLAAYYRDNVRAPITPGKHCKKCEFRNNEETRQAGLESGFDECWTEAFDPDFDPDEPKVTDIWNHRGIDKLVAEGIHHLRDVPQDQLNPIQQIQQRITLGEGDPEWWDDDLFAHLDTWQWPLHFLDFETIGPAIPFHQNLRPYETLAFQFSCHHLHEDGRIEHDEFIARNMGEFPSYDFLENLRLVLSLDDGTILRYSPHENTVLRHLRQQLVGNRPPVPSGLDRDQLIAWIDTITQNTRHEPSHRGERNMVDMYDLVKSHYYHRRMRGKKSIKAVLDAVLSTSARLRQLYASPLAFGANLRGLQVIQTDPETGETRDPYTLLPPVFEGVDPTVIQMLDEDEELRHGGAAMTAYARMQYTEMGDEERDAVVRALLKYCEMDTLAMVLLYQHWRALGE